MLPTPVAVGRKPPLGSAGPTRNAVKLQEILYATLAPKLPGRVHFWFRRDAETLAPNRNLLDRRAPEDRIAVMGVQNGIETWVTVCRQPVRRQTS